jgi:predicted nucleotidyltransferase
MNVAGFLEELTRWARSQADIEAVALVGSHARGTASEGSDVDLVIVSIDVNRYLRDWSWVSIFGNASECRMEDYGRVKSVRVFYANGPEIEFGFALPEWADVPIEAGTLRVLSDGMKLLYDPKGTLERMQQEVTSRRTQLDPPT